MYRPVGMNNFIFSFTVLRKHTMKRTIFLSLILLFSLQSFNALAQYRWAVGGRVGYDAGIHYKQFTDELHAIEIMASSRVYDYGGYKLLAMYEYQKKNRNKIIFIPNLSWILGGGIHISYYKGTTYPSGNGGNGAKYPDAVFPIGADICLGTEYEFRGLPLALGMDLRPFYEFYKPGPYYFDAGISLRYLVE